MPARSTLALPNISQVRAALAPALVFVAASLDRQYQTDFWHHLARGREIISIGRLTDLDDFTFTIRGAVLRDANWLAQVIFCRLFAWGGLELVQTINALMLAGAVALLVRICQRTTGSLATSAAAGVMVFLGIWQTFLIRPQTFSILLFVLLYGLLLRSQVKRRGLLLVPPLIAVWANLHGGFPAGLLLIGAFTLAQWAKSARGRNAVKIASRVEPSWNSSEKPPFSRPARGALPDDAIRSAELQFPTRGLAACASAWAYTAALGGAIAASLLNPYGWDIYRYAMALTARASGRQIQEWLAPMPHQWIGAIFFGSVILLPLLFVVTRRRPTVLECCLALCFLPPALRSVRMVIWWLLVAAPTFATLLVEGRRLHRAKASCAPRPEPAEGACSEPAEGASPAEPRPNFAAAIFLGILALTAVFSLPWLQRVNPLFGSVRCARRAESDLQAATDRMLARGGGRVFTRLEWGEYLSWAGHPACPVFIDGRIEVYPDSVWAEYLVVNSGKQGWAGILDKYGVDYLLLDCNDQRNLLEQVKGSPAWIETFHSDQAVLFGRVSAEAPSISLNSLDRPILRREPPPGPFEKLKVGPFDKLTTGTHFICRAPGRVATWELLPRHGA